MTCLCVVAALKPAAVHFCSYVLSIRDVRSGEQRYLIAEYIIICHGILGRFYQPQVLHSTTAWHAMQTPCKPADISMRIRACSRVDHRCEEEEEEEQKSLHLPQPTQG